MKLTPVGSHDTDPFVKLDNQHQQTSLLLRLRIKQLETALENAIRTLEYDAPPPSKRIEWAVQDMRYALKP